MLKSSKVVNYLKKFYDLRINNKKIYGIKDNWESAAFFVSPKNSRLRSCEVNSLETMKKLLISKLKRKSEKEKGGITYS